MNTKTSVQENVVPAEARPFYFKTGRRAIFFIHGFSDSLCRVNTFAKFLAEKNITVKGILLPGHGQGWEELAKTNPNDWYREVERGILDLYKEVKEVYVIGISFGGNLALKFCAEHPGVVSGLVCIETPMRIKRQYISRVAIPFFKLAGARYWNKKFLRKLNHPEKEIVFKQGVLDKMPLDNIAQIIDFLENRQGFLSKVKTNLLIIQSKKSSLLTKNSAELLAGSVKSPRKEIYRIDNVYHAFLTEAAKKRIFYRACEFFGIKYS